MPIISMSAAATLLADVAAWALVHTATGYVVHRLPPTALDHETWWSRDRRFERGGDWYRNRLRIQRWKDRLPEAGALFPGGVSKRTLRDVGAGGLERFVVETRRAELGHWLAACAAPVFAVWNPPGAAMLMVGYGIAINTPFVCVQRFNRFRAERVLRRRGHVMARVTRSVEHVR
jgi:glycosyl-4,4'-diaponeurosporenoate acyltransferase